MKPHQLSELLPAMTDAELQRLADDIRAHGLHEAIVTYEGKVLDGRHRLKACGMAGVQPHFRTFTGSEAEAASLVYGSNLARRNLTKSQLAVAGAKLKAWHALRAKERQLAGLKKGSVPVRANLPEPSDEGRAREHAAKAVGVSARMVDEAERVMTMAVPELAQRVESGEMTINEASKIVHMPKDTQLRIASKPTKQQRRAELKAALKKSSASKKQHKPSHIVQAADAPGTPLVRLLMSRLELLTNEIERSKLTPHKFAEQFLAEFDWQEPLLVRRLSYVSAAIEMVSTLSVIGQRARKEAA